MLLESMARLSLCPNQGPADSEAGCATGFRKQFEAKESQSQEIPLLLIHLQCENKQRQQLLGDRVTCSYTIDSRRSVIPSVESCFGSFASALRTGSQLAIKASISSPCVSKMRKACSHACWRPTPCAKNSIFKHVVRIWKSHMPVTAPCTKAVKAKTRPGCMRPTASASWASSRRFEAEEREICFPIQACCLWDPFTDSEWLPRGWRPFPTSRERLATFYDPTADAHPRLYPLGSSARRTGSTTMRFQTKYFREPRWNSKFGK